MSVFFAKNVGGNKSIVQIDLVILERIKFCEYETFVGSDFESLEMFLLLKSSADGLPWIPHYCLLYC